MPTDFPEAREVNVEEILREGVPKVDTENINNTKWVYQGKFSDIINAVEPGTTLRLGEGTYEVDVLNQDIASDLVIEGQGDDTLLKVPDGAVGSGEKAFPINDGSGVSNVLIKNLKIDCNQQNQDGQVGGIRIVSATGVVKYDNVTVVNSSEVALTINDSDLGIIQNCHIDVFGNQGPSVTYCNYGRISNCVVHGGFVPGGDTHCHAITFEQTDMGEVIDNMIYDLPETTTGTTILGISIPQFNFSVIGNTIDWVNTNADSTCRGIYVRPGSGITASDGVIAGNVVNYPGYGIMLTSADANAVYNISVNNNTVLNSNNASIRGDNCKNCNFNDNSIRDTSASAIYLGGTGSNNNVIGNSGENILHLVAIVDSVTDCIVKGNRGTGISGWEMTFNSTGHIVEGNYTEGTSVRTTVDNNGIILVNNKGGGISNPDYFKEVRGNTFYLASGTVTHTTGSSTTVSGVGGDEKANYQVRYLKPSGTPPDADYAYSYYFKWDNTNAQWDLVLTWDVDPGVNMDIDYAIDKVS